MVQMHKERVSFTNTLDKINVTLNYFFATIAGLSVLLMIVVIVGNAIIRVFDAPFIGTTELAGWLCAIAISFGLGYTQIKKGHVDIDLLVNLFPQGIRKVVHILILLVCIIFFALLTWQLFKYGVTLKTNGNVSETMRVAYYPFLFVVALGFCGLILALLVDFLRTFEKEAK